MRFHHSLYYFFIAFYLLSCTKPVDFNQIDEASIQSIYIVTLIHFNLNAGKFLNKYNEEITYLQDAIIAPIKDTSKPYLEKVEFTVITENSFQRNFTLTVVFYNEFGTPIYHLQPIVVPSNSNEITTSIEIPKEDVAVIYDTNSFGFSLQLSQSTDGSVISSSDTSILNLKSYVKLFFKFKKI